MYPGRITKKVMKEICLRQKSEEMSLLPGEKRLQSKACSNLMQLIFY